MAEQPREVTVDDLAIARQAGVQVLDVRSPEEFAQGHVPGAVNVPLEEVLATPRRFTDHGAHVICRSGGRSLQAAEAMTKAGVHAVSVAGGTSAWIDSGRDIEEGTQQ